MQSHAERRSPGFVQMSRCNTLIIAAIVVGLAFWVAAARLLRKLYRVSLKEARWLRLKDEGSNDNEPVITLN